MSTSGRPAVDGLIRRAARRDLDAVEALENALFDGDNLSRRSLRYYIEAPTAVFLVLEIGGEIFGDAILAFRRGSTLARLYSIAVDRTATGRGFGTHLLRHCEAEAASRGANCLRLEVRVDNAAAIQLYRRAGYTEFGRYDNYYEDGAAAVRFEKQLNQPVAGG